jgi:hypothetical protein
VRAISRLVSIAPTHRSAVGDEVAHNCGLDYCLAVIDTGTSIIVGPPPAIDPVIKKIGTVNADCSNLDTLPQVQCMILHRVCELLSHAAVQISFKVGGVEMPLGPEYYVIVTKNDNGSLNCTLGIQGITQ